MIPAIEKPNRIALEIVGESQPTTVFGTIGSTEMPSHNSIIKCLATSGPAVISTEPPSLGPGHFSRVHVVLKDLEVRTYDDPDNLGMADINYWVVEGNVGAIDTFSRNGGASIRARRIGSDL